MVISKNRGEYRRKFCAENRSKGIKVFNKEKKPSLNIKEISAKVDDTLEKYEEKLKNKSKSTESLKKKS